MNEGTPTYRLRGVGKRYGKGGATVAALRGIDVEFQPGEYTVVAGASGSGKSTLLQLLGALDTPTEGTIEFEGRDLGHLGEGEQADLRRDAIGFVFQQFNLIPTLTAAENVEAALEGTGLHRADRRERSVELLGRVGLGGRARHLPSQLSGGEQQRVAIARALANRPRVLLADEPTGNLDSSTGEAILELIRGLWLDEGLTVILITHDPTITAGAPRVLRLHDGEISDGHATISYA
jgi:putative ABC transport system ATP-binding protein